jgi:CrcB protein
MTKTLLQYLAVALGGSFGAVARLFVATLCARLFGTGFPVGTFVINITGSFLLGLFLAAISTRFTVSDTTRLAVAVGFLGAYTTFSTYTLESNALLKEGANLKAALNIVGSVAIGLLAIRIGIWVGAR